MDFSGTIAGRTTGIRIRANAVTAGEMKKTCFSSAYVSVCIR
jgi:hypothetical protein